MHTGIQLAIAMWVLTAISLTLVALRLYTRIHIVRFVGIEDHMYAWSGLFLLLFTIFIQVAVHYGLGQSFWSLGIENSSDAIFWTYVANTFAITGNAMSKLAMGLFLLRVVVVRWHKVFLWSAVIVTCATSAALTVMLWNQTTPVRTSWDPLRTPGVWNIQIQPMSVGLGVWSSICDFFFAIFPWLIIARLKVPARDKIMLAGGMSLGVIAGVCGIIRTVVLSRLDVLNYTLNFVPYFAWAGAEIAVAMVCVGIPTLRPLYQKARGLDIGYGNPTVDEDELPHFTMMDQKPASSDGDASSSRKLQTPLPPPQSPPPAYPRDSGASLSTIESGLVKPSRAYSAARYSRGEEDFIRPVEDRDAGGIWVTSQVRIRESVAEWPLRN